MTKATIDGLAFRPLSETINDTLIWAQHRPDTYVWQAGLTPEREARILAQRTFAEKAYAITNKIGGPITAISNGSGGVSEAVANTPRTFKISEHAAHAMTTNQTGKVFVPVSVI